MAEPLEGQYVENQDQAATQSYEMHPIDAEAQDGRGWQIEVNGETIEGQITEARLGSEHLGIDVVYGQRPEGYDGIVIRERGGGGAVTIPYMVHPETSDVYVGLVEESRPTIGGKVLNVPRGFLNKGEGHDDAAIRETTEETGYKAAASRVIKLAAGLNPNSTYFDTSRTNDDGTPEGVAVYAIPVGIGELEATVVDNPDGSQQAAYVFPSTVQEEAKGDGAEKIFGTRFVPIAEAVGSRDMFTCAAAGQLIVQLFEGKVPAQPIATIMSPAPEV